MKKLIYIVISLLFGFSSLAQVKFEAKASREKMGINERVKVEFIIDKDADNFLAPDFKGFKRLAGPNQSISQSWVNGKSSFQKTYTYFLEPQRRGRLTIGQAEIEYQGKTYKTSPIDIEVTAAVDNPNSYKSIAKSRLSDAIHLVAEVSKTKPYLNEEVYVVYKLFIGRDVNIRNYRVLDDPKFNDFWSQNIDIDQLEVKEGEYGGEPYQYVELRKTLLYPQKTGELVIEPLTVALSVQVPSDKRDIFGRRQYEYIEKNTSAKTRKLQVKPLPEEGKPANFTGAVGQFDIALNTSKTSLEARESLTANLKISGTGNLSLMSLPDLKIPASLEVYEPERKDSYRTTYRGLSGYISNKYTIVPEFKGNYKISPVKFTYFDPNEEKYKTTTTKEVQINVEAGPENPLNQQARLTNEEANKAPLKNRITSDMSFDYIATKTQLRPASQSNFFKSTSFWALFISPLLLMPLFILVKKNASKLAVSETNKKQRKANQLAKKYLSEAKKNLGNKESFFDALERALHNYLKAKLQISTAEMSKEKIIATLNENGIEEAVSQKFIRLLSSCEMAKYSPSSNEAMQEEYQQATQIISKLDKNL